MPPTPESQKVMDTYHMVGLPHSSLHLAPDMCEDQRVENFPTLTPGPCC